MMGNAASKAEGSSRQSLDTVKTSSSVARISDSNDYPRQQSTPRSTSRPTFSANNEGYNFPGYARSRQLLQQQRNGLSLSDINKGTGERKPADRVSDEFWPAGISPPKGPRAMVIPNSKYTEDETNQMAITELLKLEANERRQSSSTPGRRSYCDSEKASIKSEGHQKPHLSIPPFRPEPAFEYSKLQASSGRVSQAAQRQPESEIASRAPRRNGPLNDLKVPSEDTTEDTMLDVSHGNGTNPTLVSTGAPYTKSKDCDTLPVALDCSLTPTHGDSGNNCAALTLDRFKNRDSPPLPLLPKSLGSHLRFNGDDTKSLSSDSGRTPSETSSTPSDMRIKKCHVCRKPQASDDTFRCARCSKRSGFVSAAASKRTGSSLRPNGDKTQLPASVKQINIKPLNDNERPMKRQKLDHSEQSSLGPPQTSVQTSVNEATSSAVQAHTPLQANSASVKDTILNHSFNRSIGAAEKGESFQTHSPMTKTVVPIEAQAPGPRPAHESNELGSEPGQMSVATDRGQCLELVKPSTVDTHMSLNSDSGMNGRSLHTRGLPSQPIKTHAEVSDFYDIDSFDIGVGPYESNATILSSDPSANKCLGKRAQKRSLPPEFDDDALSDKSISIESDQPEPTDINRSVRRSSSPALFADKVATLREQDRANSSMNSPLSSCLDSIQTRPNQPPTPVDATLLDSSPTSDFTPRTNGVGKTSDSTTSGYFHKHSSAAKTRPEAANPSLKKYPLSTSPCSMCGKRVLKSFSKNSSKTLCVLCAKAKGSSIPATGNPTPANGTLLSPELPNVAPLDETVSSTSFIKPLSSDNSKQTPQRGSKPQQSRPMKVFPEQTSPFKTVSPRTKRKFAAGRVNGAPGPSVKPILKKSHAKPAVNGHTGAELHAIVPQPPSDTKELESVIPSAIPLPSRRTTEVEERSRHPDGTDSQKQVTPIIRSPRENRKESPNAEVVLAQAISQAVLEHQETGRASLARNQHLERELAAKELELEKLKVEIAALKEQTSKSDESEHKRTIAALKEQLQSLQHQSKREQFPPPSHTEKDIFKAWPQYRPEVVWFDRGAKIAEIKQRPSRKATFGKRLANIRKERDNVHHEIDRPAPGSHKNPKKPRTIEETRPSGGLESYGAGSPEPGIPSNEESDAQPTFEERIGVPPNSIPTIYDKALAYRDGTKVKGKLPRAKVVYKVGRNVAGQLK
ncbi:MAG: hypothetical protein M1812_007273 [Candelaria pacifica]|nr:MAG: hypothetical protein M1812_007273 [Candelaria pacifica]